MICIHGTDPDEAIDAILQAPRSPRLNVVELGPGTGLATRCLFQRALASASAEKKDNAVTIETYQSFEPSSGMRAAFQKNIVDALVPGWRAESASPGNGGGGGGGGGAGLGAEAPFTIADGTFEHFAQAANAGVTAAAAATSSSAAPSSESDSGPAYGQNDVVLIAQAWHWCADFDAALREAARALRKGGVLALLWNLEDREAAPWVARARDLFERYEDDAPQCE